MVLLFLLYSLRSYVHMSLEGGKLLFLSVGLAVLKLPRILVKIKIWYQNPLNQKFGILRFNKLPGDFFSQQDHCYYFNPLVVILS